MPILTTYWQALADALDDRESVGLSGGSATTAVASAFISADAGVTSNLYTGRWIFHRTGTNSPQQRKVTSFDKTTGAMTVPTWSDPTGGGVDLTSLFPARHDVGAETDYRTLTNRGLGRMTIVATVSVTIGAFDVVNMTSFASFVRPEQLVEVREPSPLTGRSAVPSDRGWRFVPGYPSYLQAERPFDTAPVALEVSWTRAANTWIGVSGTFAESTGLASESDQALPTVDDFLPFGLAEALPVLIARSPGRPNAEWLALLKQAEADIARSPYNGTRGQQAPAGQVA